MGSCHPNGSLYEKPLDLRAAQREHLRFREELEKNGCVVRTVREILAQDCETDVMARVALEDLAMSSMKYELATAVRGTDSPIAPLDAMQLTSTEAYLLSDEYKKTCIEKMDVEQLVEVVLTRPTILLQKADKDTELLVVNYTYEPLVNLIFCRDQQITTARGVVMGRPRSPIRQREVEVMQFCFKKLGVPIVGRIQSPGTLEGGDFFPTGLDLALLGVGLRSNMDAAQYLMDNDLFGTRRVAIVKDYFDQHQQRMHLDTVFNIIAPKLCVMLEDIQGANSPQCRLVDEYTKGADGKYHLSRHDVEFHQYIVEEGYTVISLTNDMQYAYGCNGLNLGNNTLITVDRSTAKFIARSQLFHGKIVVVDFSNNTNMFGSVHCCSQVISRRAPNQYDSTILVSARSHSGGMLDVPTPHTIGSLSPAYAGSPPQLGGASPLSVPNHSAGHFIIATNSLPSSNSSVSADTSSLPVSLGAMQHPPAPKNKQVAARYMMIAPNNFDVNKTSAEDNMLMASSQQRFLQAVQKKGQGKRDVHAILLREFAELHRVLTVKLGAEVFLFTHESFHQTPEAVFIADWFSTHREGDFEGGKAAKRAGEGRSMVLYSMRASSRRNERRPDLVSFLKELYPTVVNLRPFEAGKAEVTEDAFAVIPQGVCGDACKPLEFSSFVLDRQTRTAFAARSCSRFDADAFQAWAQETGYKVVLFDLNSSNTTSHAKLLQHAHHTRTFMCIFSTFSMVCFDAIAPADREQVRKALVGRPIIEFTLAQCHRFGITGAFEVYDHTGKSVIVVSKTAYDSYTADQLAAMEALGTAFEVVRISEIEQLGGGSVSGLISSLY